MPAGGDGQHFGPDCPRATDVKGSVTNHQHLLTAQFVFQNSAATVARNCGYLIAVRNCSTGPDTEVSGVPTE